MLKEMSFELRIIQCQEKTWWFCIGLLNSAFPSFGPGTENAWESNTFEGLKNSQNPFIKCNTHRKFQSIKRWSKIGTGHQLIHEHWQPYSLSQVTSLAKTLKKDFKVKSSQVFLYSDHLWHTRRGVYRIIWENSLSKIRDCSQSLKQPFGR